MTPASAELLAAVERSPRAAAAHDRKGWVGLFTADGRIDDPVGSRPHIGREQIRRFYDTFIAPRQITFHRDFDVVQDETVVRDLALEVVMASGLTMNIPAFLRYDLRAVGGEWKIARLRAYWELPAMVAVMLRQGVRSVPTSMQLTAGLLRHQGLSGTAGFVSGFRGVGTGGKRRVGQCLAADDQVHGWSKLIAAGDTVAASITVASGRGVAFCEIDRPGGMIRRTDYLDRP